MIDHTGVTVADFPTSRAFYESALAPLGFTKVMELGPEITGGFHTAGFGEAPKPEFWISSTSKAVAAAVHIAFRVTSRAQVDAFHAAALAAGARDNGAPGLRPHYHPNYYGAFVLDPDGHNIEAVCHEPV